LDYLALAAALASLAGLAGFLVVAYFMSRLLRVLGGPGLVYTVSGFVFLSLAQTLAALSYVTGSEALAYSYYIGSTASSLAGYASLALATRPRRVARAREEEALASPAVVVVMPTALDAAASLAALQVARASEGAARAAFSALAVSHAVKAAALLAGVSGLWAFLAAELLRTTASAALAVYYAGSVLAP